jgi:NADPH:quinone reductase-like Zn-dependent oxidoreductase
MKAVVYEKYGSPDVLELREVAKPVPRETEVLVKVCAASVNAADWHLLRADPFIARSFSGLIRPRLRILGADIAGQVEAVGAKVTLFKPGDEVFGDIFSSGLGGFAEYARAREDSVVSKPAGMTFEQAAAMPVAGFTALRALRDKGQVQPGQKVLINGAGGGVGTFAVQIAKVLGAEVTAVCGTHNLDLARSLGADHVIDYTKEDFARSGKQYDLILGVNGFHPLSEYKRSLCPKGVYVMVGGTNRQIFQGLLLGPWMSVFGGKKMGVLSAKASGEDLEFLKGLFEAGRIRPVIDRRYPLAEVADAIRYLEEGHARGKVVVTMPA